MLISRRSGTWPSANSAECSPRIRTWPTRTLCWPCACPSAEQYAEATREAESSIHLAPDDSFGHYVLACVYNDRNRFKEAREAVREAIRLNPFDATPWGLLALVEYALEQWPAALEAAERGLQADPEDSRCANARSMALVKLGRKAEAAAAVAETLAREPENALSQATQGWTLLEQGNSAAPKCVFARRLRLEPGMQWARAGMVTALKARNPFYRLVLGYFLWMSKLGPRVQWALIIGLLVGVRLLESGAERVPALAAPGHAHRLRLRRVLPRVVVGRPAVQFAASPRSIRQVRAVAR